MIFRKELGKIKNVSFGHGGYQDACIGINFELSGNGWGVMDNKTVWDYNMIPCSEYCKWTEKDRTEQYADIVRYVSTLLKEAKVNSVDKLKGIPVEVTFNRNSLVSWRILTEIL